MQDDFPTLAESIPMSRAAKTRMPRSSHGNKLFQGAFNAHLHNMKQYMSPFIEKRPAQSLRPLG